jgi:hypothetical protein
MDENLKGVFSKFITDFYLCIENSDSLGDKITCIQDSAGEIKEWLQSSIAAYSIIKESKSTVDDSDKEKINITFDFLENKEIHYCIVNDKKGKPDNLKWGEIVELCNKPTDNSLNLPDMNEVKSVENGNEFSIKKDYLIHDFSPICANFDDILTNKPDLADMIVMMNSENSSRRVFDELHFNENDQNLTIGFGHFATHNINAFFKEMNDKGNEEIKNSIIDIFAYKLYKNKDDKYYKQILDDPIINTVSIAKDIELNVDDLSLLTFKEWRKFINKIIFDKLVNLDKESIEASKTKYGIDLWSYKISKDKREEKKFHGIKVPFPGRSDEGSGFWFNDIMIDALKLRRICRYQVEFFERHIYYYDTKNCVEQFLNQNYSIKAKKDIAACKGLIASIISYISSGSYNFTFCKKSEGFLKCSIGRLEYGTSQSNGIIVPDSLDLTNPDIIALLIWHKYNVDKYKKQLDKIETKLKKLEEEKENESSQEKIKKIDSEIKKLNTKKSNPQIRARQKFIWDKWLSYLFGNAGMLKPTESFDELGKYVSTYYKNEG